ncbi:DNA-processing protein DprA [Streptococcus oricebi]|uniref:DNA-protecting protein DprA n=1 Tax=Streptococcus oricebi TaxID=1547447 RepID=A0ABS5B365_9STRE|nr:DNA-processing protein DprA [Streptococcus oricebi]MBP2623278.1 DNA-protecting protein DprA [Streptococcus oricebi]
MDNFGIYKLKQAGLNNQQVLNVLSYLEMQEEDEELSPRDLAVVSECRNPALFMERYRQLDEDLLRENFDQYPSFSILDDVYPWDLSEIYNAPSLLFYQGNLKLLDLPKVAVVGSRNSSRSGNKAVEKVIKELNNELVIVSGLARGIDTVAHMTALQTGGRSIAVIGTGLDVYYPRENTRLQKYLAKNHLVLSEYGPGEPPLKFHFPERNRIIAGLCRGVIVAQAKIRSGSLITCERAMEEGRDVFAIPDSILDGQSAGCHRLIQEGAKCISSGSDVLAEFQF